MGHASRRRAMVERQLRGRGIRDERVLAAMGAVERHRFVPRARRWEAYEDRPLPIGGGQTISQPWIVARMAEALELGPDDRVLEVGAGCGYAAAVLAELAGRVTAVEQDPDLAERARSHLADRANVEVVTGDGAAGRPDVPPFDAISVAAAGPSVPEPLRSQLADGGRLVMPVGPRTHQELLLLRRDGDVVSEESLGPVRFVPLTGPHGVDPP
ncbi:protein-L-isoaspartate(D-aspartate) O-methyltransferase [Salsipaludibacter albus]|uniref:protein-L-isoaspartate(D-aspartate) O-methyltransferase n=1 Tax=Salsipaludibacter albus TaxID=2849650 RepID=UPI001EE4089D|nr:protein-L-isoaspartate(D-aspartate) O-methyltransferase [Salsipaludibacter albus]MBY5161821.1 protein-L-isoaspartate(D-aspartate) O-methyltransferase [Salsipaludibacter albus]